MEYDSYRRVILPHIDWFMSEISKSKNGFIIVKIKDIRTILGEDFQMQHDTSIYSSMRDILLENEIKVKGRTHLDGSKMLLMEMARPEEIRTSAEVRNERRLITANKHGFDTFSQYNRSLVWGGETSLGKVLPESENTECSRYFGEYIERKYVSQIFDNPIPFQGTYCGSGNFKKYDYECKNGFLIKHVASCTRIDESHVGWTGDTIPYWGYLIRKNDVPDYWTLSAWDNRESLEPKYVWVIPGKEPFKTQYSYREGDKPFWNRATWVVYATKKGIDRMSKYEVTDKLEKLKDICNIARKEE